MALIARSTRRHVREVGHVPLVRMTAAMVWLPLWYFALVANEGA